jgi:hypothetical protein
VGEQPGDLTADPSAPDAPPLTRRQRRLLEEELAVSAAGVVPRIAPVTDYTWDREVDRETRLPEPSRPAPVAAPTNLYRDIPSRWGTASVWVIAFMPWITGLCLFAALLLEAWGMTWQQWGALVLPCLLTLAAAQRDARRLRSWGHRQVAHWAWSLLGAPAYLIARTVVLRRSAGLGSAPLWVWLVNLLLTAGAGVYLVTVTGMYLMSEGYTF